MKDDTAISRLYIDLTAHLIAREIAKFRRGEQAALVSFANVAKLARNARRELAALSARAHEPAMPDPPPSYISVHAKPATDQGRVARAQAPQF
jgi:hypothetical protein